MSARNINRSECEITQAVDMAQMHMFDLAAAGLHDRLKAVAA